MKTKEKILALLEENRGRSISGEALAVRLGVSRNAVWKAVNELKKSGHKIEAITNKGYCLCYDDDVLSARGMNAPKIHIYPVLESTNKTAKEMALSEAEHGTVIIANSQTAGRGRYGRSFFSPASCGIYMSIILHPDKIGFDTPTLVTSFAAVSVCEAIEAVSDKTPRIKWVNDIFIEGKKVCGILTEAVTDFESGGIQWIVVGIGVNFKKAELPEELREKAGAVFDDSGTVTRNQLAGGIIKRMVSEKPDSAEEILKKYKSRMMMLGEEVSVLGSGQSYRAVVSDIDSIGRLIVRREDGEVAVLSSGEISIVTH
jgi:BirA family biotin operon repressor/biotin-[acetyl-CoA-carboxylase] ligase